MFKPRDWRALALCLVLFLALSPLLHAKTIRIGVLVDYMSPDFLPQFDRLEQEIRAVVGNTATIELDVGAMLVNNFDLDTARQQYQSLLDDNTDIILAFGPINSVLVQGQKTHRKPTILFGAVNLDVIDIDPNKAVSGVDNFTYIIAPFSYSKDLEDFRSIYPFKKVAVVGSFGPWDTALTRNYLDSLFADIDGEHVILDYQNLAQFERDLGDVDAVYMAEGFGIPRQEMQQLAKLLIDKKLPSFTATQLQDVIDGWLATNQGATNLERLFRRIALGVEAVLENRNLSQRPVFMELADTITVNYNTAEKVEVPIRYSQIATLNLVGNFEDFIFDRRYSILQAVDIALKQNLALKTSQYDVAIAEQNLAAAKTTYYPNLSVQAAGRQIDPDLARLSGGSNPEQTTSGTLQLSQTLYSEDGSAAIGSQKNLLLAQEQTYNVNRLDTVLATTRASFNLLRTRNALRSQAQNLEITRRNLRIAQQNFDAGQASKADIFRFQSELASNMQNVIEAINSFRQAQHALNVILNNPVGFRIEIEDVEVENGPFEPKDFGYQQLSETLDDPAEQDIFQGFLLQKAFELSPELAALNFNLKAVERDLAQYGWRRFIPTVSANAQYNRIFDRSGVGVPDPNLALDSDYNYGLVFSIPLFNSNSDNVNRRLAQRRREQLLVRVESQKQQIENNIRDSVLDVSGRIANIELSDVAEQAALQSLKLVEASYANGAATITDLIDSQNNYLQAQLASSNALYNFLDSAVAMERAVGVFLFLDKQSESPQGFTRQYLEYRKNIPAGASNE